MEGVAAYELNIWCPNVERGGVSTGTDPALTAEVVGAAAGKILAGLCG